VHEVSPSTVNFMVPKASRRRVLSAAWIVLSLLPFVRPLRELVHLALTNDDMSYVVVIPLLAAGVLVLEHRRIREGHSYDKLLGSVFLVLAGLVALLAHFSRAGSIDHLQLSGDILSLVLFWIAGFAFLHGKSALHAASFPLAFLLLTIPLPDFLLGRVVYVLQAGSAWVTGALFELLRIPFLREGFVFHLPVVNIEVAKECSGIRSSMALLVLALLVAHFQLKTVAGKILFVACGLFMMIVKNGIRIATLTLLAMYVDPGFLFGRLHQQGGVVFFLLGLLLLVPILWLLKRGESWWRSRQTPQVPQSAAL
jgi:exosortase